MSPCMSSQHVPSNQIRLGDSTTPEEIMDTGEQPGRSDPAANVFFSLDPDSSPSPQPPTLCVSLLTRFRSQGGFSPTLWPALFPTPPSGESIFIVMNINAEKNSPGTCCPPTQNTWHLWERVHRWPTIDLPSNFHTVKQKTFSALLVCQLLQAGDKERFPHSPVRQFGGSEDHQLLRLRKDGHVERKVLTTPLSRGSVTCVHSTQAGKEFNKWQQEAPQLSGRDSKSGFWESL